MRKIATAALFVIMISLYIGLVAFVFARIAFG